MLVRTFNEYELRDEFVKMGRDYFSLDGYRAILDLFEECGGTTELDVIAICCDFTEAEPEDIIEDYLYTNVCLAQEIKDLTAMILSMPGIKADAAVKAVNFIFAANIEFINTAYAAVEEHYGTFENYLREALHVTPEEQEKIRDLYLSKA